LKLGPAGRNASVSVCTNFASPNSVAASVKSRWPIKLTATRSISGVMSP
jgi:hypothetical protein